MNLVLLKQKYIFFFSRYVYHYIINETIKPNKLLASNLNETEDRGLT